jgi:hypothetical protein
MTDARSGATRVAVVLMRCGDKLLVVYNDKWRAFTFPMTKLRPWEFADTSQIADPDHHAIAVEEQQGRWLDVAAHAAVECLGRPCCPQPLLDGPIEVEYSEVERSGRDGADRIYHYKVYTLEAGQEFDSRRQPFAWLTAEEIRDGKHRPMSPTMLKILGQQEVNAIVREWK